jgi:hypothetical protein
MRCSRYVVSGLLLATVAGPGLAQEKQRPSCMAERRHARSPVGNAAVVVGSGYIGEHIIYIGDGGGEAARRYGMRNVGFKFTVISLACVHLWTWGGTYCAYEPVFEKNRLTDKYKVISKTEAAELLGKHESDLTSPFWYRYPPGLMLLAAAFLFGLISALVHRLRKPPPPVDPVGQRV